MLRSWLIGEKAGQFRAAEQRAAPSDFLVILASYMALSVAFSLFAWSDHLSAPRGLPHVGLAAMGAEIGGHLLFGFLAALPTRRASLMGTGALLAILIDADHLLYYLGLSNVGRPSHSFIFMIAAMLAIAVAVRLFGSRNLTSAQVALLVMTGVLAHFAFDSITGGGMPLLFPLTNAEYIPGPTGGVLFEAAALVAGIACAFAGRRAPGTEAVRDDR